MPQNSRRRSQFTINSICLAIFCLGITTTAVYAQQDFYYIRDPLDVATDVTTIIGADNPLPITHFEKGNWKVSVKPIYFTVSQLVDIPQSFYKGEDLNGWGGSAGISYAFTDRWLVYGIFTGAKMDGKATGGYGQNNIPASQVPSVVEIDGTNSVYILNTGFGYELVKNREGRKWSIPVFFGLFMQRYNSDMKLAPLPNAPNDIPWLDISGNGTLFGASAGLEAARNLGKYFQIVPSLTVGFNFARPKLQYVVTREDPNGTCPVGLSGEENKVGTTLFPMAGLNLTFRPWGLTLSVSGLLTAYYSAELFEGLEMTKFSVSYSFGNYTK